MKSIPAGLGFKAHREQLQRWTGLPGELVGCWNLKSAVLDYRADGTFFLGSFPAPYTISNGGQQLDWDGWIWERKYGSGQTLVGVWSEPETNEEWNMRADGTYEWYAPIENSTPLEFFGIYQAQENMLKNLELRGFVSVEGNMMTLDAPYNPIITFPFEIIGNELRLHAPDGLQIAIRAVCT